MDNVSKVMGSAHPQSGRLLSSTPTNSRSAARIPRGAFDFSSNSNNPFDSKDGFSNALLGVINTYSEGTARVNGDWNFNNLEFYVQDNWRVSSA